MELGLQEFAEAVQIGQAAREAAGLPVAAQTAFGAFERDIASRAAQVIGQHLAQAGGVRCNRAEIKQVLGVAVSRPILVFDQERPLPDPVITTDYLPLFGSALVPA